MIARLLLGIVLLALGHTAAGAHEPSTPSSFTFVIPEEARRWQRAVIGDARYYFGLDVDYTVFFAQIHQESRWKATAASRFASGLSQFTPRTAAGVQKGYAKDLAEFCREQGGCPLSPRWAIRAQILYDRDLWWQYKFAPTADERWGFALAAYNGGAGHIRNERLACRAPECDPSRYFGHVQNMCGADGRAQWACDENRSYPSVILFRWRPGYVVWLSR